ncbi:transcriptional regulator [Escherichia coli]|nr:transcriptional regulator [Escherichia coli]
MLPGCCKNGIVISKIPVMQAGLKEVKIHVLFVNIIIL